MKYPIVLCLAILCVAIVTACGQVSDGSGQEVIAKAKAMQATTAEQAQYLVGQARALYNSKQFQDAVDVAQHVLKHLDRDSQEAKNLLEMAKNELIKAGQKVAADAKAKLGM